MVRIILIRHGETTWNVEGRYQGQEDIPLSPKGIAQGKAAGLALKDISIDAAVSGPLSRAFDTCRFITEYHHVNIRIDERITEISHGRWEGVHADEIKKNYPKELPRIEINSQMKLMGNAGCNNINGTVEADEKTIKITAIMMTKMACPAAAEETEFVNALQGANSYQVENNRLSLMKNGQETLVFRKTD